jgi:hypothetical protein
VNSGDKEKLEGFVKAHRPDRPDALDRMLDLRWNIGGLDLYSIESSEASTFRPWCASAATSADMTAWP